MSIRQRYILIIYNRHLEIINKIHKATIQQCHDFVLGYSGILPGCKFSISENTPEDIPLINILDINTFQYAMQHAK